jgi:hypothetical protein
VGEEIEAGPHLLRPELVVRASTAAVSADIS